MRFSSDNDAFNWTDPTATTQTSRMTPLSLTLHSVETELPPYIFCLNTAWEVSVTNAKLERKNACPIVIVGSTVTNNKYIFRFTISESLIENKPLSLLGVASGTVYNGGSSSVDRTSYLDTNYVVDFDSLPSFTIGWCEVPSGLKVRNGGVVYVAKLLHIKETNTWSAEWVPENQKSISMGTTTVRTGLSLSSSDAGLQYYDSTLKKYVLWNGTAWTNLDGTALA